MADIGVTPPPDINVAPNDDNSPRINATAIQVWYAGLNAYIIGSAIEGM